MVDVRAFALAQKLVWARYILDENFDNEWKRIEISALTEFHPDFTILFRAQAPENILKTLNFQLTETLRT